MKKLLIFAGMALLGAGIWYGYTQYKKLTDFCYTFGGFEVLKLNREKITLLVKMNVKNNSSVPVKITSYDFNVYLNNIFVSKVSSKKEQIIAPNKFTVLSLLIDVEPKNIKGLANWDFISKILLDINNVMVKITGTITASVAGIGVKNYALAVNSKLKEMMPDRNVPSAPCV